MPYHLVLADRLGPDFQKDSQLWSWEPWVRHSNWVHHESSAEADMLGLLVLVSAAQAAEHIQTLKLVASQQDNRCRKMV